MDPAVRELELPQLPWNRCKTEFSIWCRQRISLGPAPLSKPTAELCQHSLFAPWALLGQQPNTRQPNTFPSAELPSDTHRDSSDFPDGMSSSTAGRQQLPHGQHVPAAELLGKCTDPVSTWDQSTRPTPGKELNAKQISPDYSDHPGEGELPLIPI